MRLRRFNAIQEEKRINRKQNYEKNVKIRTVVLSIFVLVGSIMLFTYSKFSTTTTVDVMHAKVGRFVVTLNFNANGGSVSPTSKDLAIGEDYGTLPIPSRNGYTFNGWYTDATNGTLVGPTTTMESGDTTIYAHWNRNTYDLVVMPNDGEWETHTTNQTYQLNYEEEKAITDPTRVGYTFTGWTLTGTGSTFDSNTKKFTMGYENATLEANYEINSYTLTIDLDDGSEEDEYTLNYGATKTIEEPEREGYTFAGWQDENGNTTLSYLSGETYTQPAYDVELTATWTPNNYKWIVYHQKQSVDGTEYNTADTEEGEDAFGETFSGTLQSYTGFANPALQERTIAVENNYPPTTNVITYQYTRNQYLLTINPNGGEYNNTSNNTTEQVYYEATRNISDPTRTCYTFNNWTLTGTGSTIQNRVFTMGTAAATLTANWTLDQFTITFNPNGGSIVDPNNATQTVSCGSAINLLTGTDLTREDYTFAGWWTTADNTGTEVTAQTIPTESQTIYAHWTWDYEGITADEIEYTYAGKTTVTNVNDALDELRGILS